MKRKWHIKTHLLVTLIGLTTTVLLTVALVFNLSMYGFIRSRVSTQLSNVSQSASEERRGGERGQEPGPGEAGDRRFDEHPDRVMGTKGSAVLLNDDGSIFLNLHGDETVAESLAAWYRARTAASSVRDKVVFLESGTYVVSASADPVTQGKIMLTYVDVTSVMAFTRQINIVLLLVILAAVLVSVLLSRRFARSFAAPVRSLSDFAREIGSGNLEPQELGFRDVEFDALAGSMNRMASDLRAAQQKQEVSFIKRFQWTAHAADLDPRERGRHCLRIDGTEPGGNGHFA